MQKTIVIGCLWCCALGLQAQGGNYRQQYLLAEEAYGIGRFERSVEILSRNIDKYDPSLKASSYRLLALCHLAMDNAEAARRNVSLLLKEVPYYNTTVHDPLRFVELVEQMKQGNVVTITTASQQAETLEEAPVPVTLITEEMIRNSGARHLVDLLTLYVPGVAFIEGDELNVAMHGIYSTAQEKILVLLNGHRLNSRATNAEAPDFRTSLDKIKQIEVLRGPSSSLYGNVALTAVVNIITKRGYEINGTKVSVGMGNHGTYRADFLLGKSAFNLDFTAWASVYASRGEKRRVQVGDEAFWGKVEREGYLYIGGFNHKPAYDIGCTLHWNDFSLLFTSQSAKKVNPYNTVLYPGLYSYDRYRLVDGVAPGRSRQATHAELAYQANWGRWTGKLVAFADFENSTFYDVGGDSILPPDRYLPAGPGEVVPGGPATDICDYGVFQVQNWQDFTYGGMANFNYDFQWKKNRASLLLGGQAENYVLQDNKILAGDHFDRIVVTYSSPNNALLQGNELNLSLFSQLKTDLGKFLSFNGGLRYDYKRRFNRRNLSALSPRVSLIYRANKGSYWKASYAHSFVDAPYFYRASTIKTYSGGSSLDAEHMDAFQLSYAKVFKPIGCKLELNAYYNAFDNVISYDSRKEEEMYSNSGRLKLAGIEGVFQFRTAHSSAYLNCSYQYVIDSQHYTATGHQINNVPSFQCNARYAYTFDLLGQQMKLTPWVMGLFSSRQASPIVDAYLYKGEQQVRLPDHTIPASLTFNLGCNCQYQRMELALGLYNVFDTHSYRVGIAQPIPQMGFNCMAKLAYTF